eukprot:451290_1
MVSLFFVLWLSLCYTPSSGIGSGKLTTTEKRKILDLHNELRDRVAGGGLIGEGHPAATDMNQLIWDDGLATLAQNWVNTCQYKHNPNAAKQLKAIRDKNPQGTKWGKRLGKKMGDGTIWVGENLARRTYGTPYTLNLVLKQMESGWFDEYKSWTYGPAGLKCTRTYCSHYTQMVWANTRYVGCAVKNNCKGNSKNHIFACNYFPLGNMNTKKTPPYKRASSASKKATNCMNDRTIHAAAQYSNVALLKAGQYKKKWYALCGGGACATQCAGDSTSRGSCDECKTATDCNDGTTSRTSGRDRCGSSKKQPAPTAPPAMKCPSGKRGCKDHSKCIPNGWWCDGTYTDCPDRSDENDCNGVQILDCVDGYSDTVCMTAHDTNHTQFIFNDTSLIEYEWEMESCQNGKPVYMADEYVLAYTERYMNDTMKMEPFWIVRGEEEYAYCNEYDLSDCGAGSWYKLIVRLGYIGYEVDETMATFECLVSDPAPRVVAKNSKMTTQIVVLSVLVVVFVLIGCFGCICYRLRNTKKTVDDHGDTKKLAQNDEMQEVDGTQMMEEIEVEMLKDTEVQH